MHTECRALRRGPLNAAVAWLEVRWHQASMWRLQQQHGTPWQPSLLRFWPLVTQPAHEHTTQMSSMLIGEAEQNDGKHGKRTEAIERSLRCVRRKDAGQPFCSFNHLAKPMVAVLCKADRR